MMKKLSKLLIILVVLAMFAGCFTACDMVNSILGNDDVNNGDVNEEPGVNDDASNNGGDNGGDNGGEQKPDDQKPDDKVEPEFVDYVAQLKFNPNSGRVWAKVKVHSYIDGDTTHFDTVDGTVIGNGDYIKARYLAINTPESTGIIEPWGKKASNYTKTQLMQATEIIIESDTDKWNLDSTGARYLLWIWYKTADDTEYRNLNLEILQQGLAFGSGVSSNVYGDIAVKILNQSKTLKLHVFNKTAKDPDYYYGGLTELTLKEIKSSIVWDAEQGRYVSPYEGKIVKFEAVVGKQVGATIYVEEYDAETGLYFGMQIFTGYVPIDYVFETIGARVSIVGTLQYYENGNTFQVSNLKYRTSNPDWEGGCRVLDKNGSASYVETDVERLLNDTVDIEIVEKTTDENGEVVENYVTRTFKYSEIAHYTTVSVSDLTVKSVYTTVNDRDSNGALTLTCEDQRGNTIQIRTNSQLTTVVDGETVLVTAADFPVGTVISVKGIVDYFNNNYQIKVFVYDDITIQ